MGEKNRSRILPRGTRIFTQNRRPAYSGMVLDAARFACCSRMAASSASTLFFSSSVKTALARGGGMSCTAGYAGALAARCGVPSGRPPACVGSSDKTDEQEARTTQHAPASATPTSDCQSRLNRNPDVTATTA
jgi:hypothetical protein